MNPFGFVREAYAAIAAAHEVPLRIILTVCSNQAEHRRRVEARFARGEKAIDWNGVQGRASLFDAMAHLEDALRLDTIDGAARNAEHAAAYCLGG